MKKSKIIFVLTILIIISLLIYLLYYFNVIPHSKYTNADFNIPNYISKTDKDNDNIDDQTDILLNVKEYLKTKPQYKSKYYSTGYPDDNYGVCTDVVAFGLLNAGYDLRELVNNDIKLHRNNYNISSLDEFDSFDDFDINIVKIMRYL